MLREYVHAVPSVLAMVAVAAIAIWLYASVGPLVIVGGVVGVFAIVVGHVMWRRSRATRRLRDE